MTGKYFFIITFLFFTACIFSNRYSLTMTGPDSTHARPGAPKDSLYRLLESAQDSVKKYVPDTTVKKKKAEPLNYIYNKPLNENSHFVSDSVFLKNDYRYAADFLSTLPGFFVQSLGNLGQPEEVMLYGQGLGNISFFQDGMPLNHAPENYYNLNQLQSESIDSLELVPLSRSFLYGSENNAVALNAVSSFRVSRLPYTRIRFYQAPDGEGMIDAQLHEQINRRLNLFFELTNRKKDYTYLNNAYSNWSGRLGLTYPVIDSALTMGLEYSYQRTITDLWGGVDFPTIAKLYPGQTSIAMYDYVYGTPVFMDNSEMEQTNTIIYKVNSNIIEDQPGSLRLYYRDDVNEFTLNSSQSVPGAESAKFHLAEHLTGAALSQRIKLPLIHIDATGGIEKWWTNNTQFADKENESRSYASGVATFDLLDSTIAPAFFIKYLNKGGSSYPGLGADVTLWFPGHIKLYAGLSRYSQSFLPENNTITNMEIRLETTYASGYLSLTGYRTKPGSNYHREALVWQDTALVKISTPAFIANMTGVQLRMRQEFKPLAFEAAVNYLHQSTSDGEPQTTPTWSGTAGLYYEGIHFQSSLHIRTGFVANFSTSYHPRAYDYFSMQSYPSTVVSSNPDAFNLNFTAAGEIKKAAIVYFTWENLFDYKYYYVPYYPMTRRGLRFGLAWDLFN